MKEAPASQLLHHTRSGPQSSPTTRVHERGDKVVVNGAKESLLSILRRFTCQCTKHTLDKLISKFLTSSKVSASYDILVWMLLFIKINCEPALYEQILKEYLMKMQKKRDEEENHQSQKYIDSKKKTLQKFIQSAEELMCDQIEEKVLERSVGALYSKGKSRENAFRKLKVYLDKVTSNSIDGSIGFQQTGCSFLLPPTAFDDSNNSQQQTTGAQPEKAEPQSMALLPSRKKSSTPSMMNIPFQIFPLEQKMCFNLCPLSSQEQETEDTVELKADNQENKSRRNVPKRESYDLFDELIQAESHSYSSFLPYYIN